jgi:hypothetical protein
MNNTRTRSVRAGIVLAISSGISLICNAANVVTHHMDNFRTGWNPQETVLTSSNVNSSNFSQQAIALFDEQVDAQPLVLTNQAINGTTYPIVVYVVTEYNSVYAVNGISGAILAQVNLGAGVDSISIPPGTCNNNSSFMGISSTPVIDTSSGTLYVVTTAAGSGTINHYLHALSTSTLADKVAALEVAPPGAITYSRQRSALTLFNGGVLIPFASFCDKNPTTSRGYIVYANMNGTAAQTSFETSYYNLASIWMSGSGPAVTGNSIYLATGNGSGPYPPANNNLAESLVLLTGSSGSPPTLTYSGSFTPSNYQSLDQNDQDFGAGGVLLVPSGAPTSISPSTSVQFVTAAAKNGGFYVNSPTLLSDQILSIGNCWCGTSFFTGGDASGHVVLSGGSQIQLTNTSAGGLTATSAAVTVPGANGNLFTTISSNGTVPGTGVVWTVTGPDANYQLNLHAYSANSLTPIYSSPAGWWSNTGGNSNTVPVVANGHVYVASNGEMLIWGASTGALPAPPTNISSNGSTDCPLMDVSWSPSAGATSYNVYYQPYGAAIVGSRRTKYTGSSTSVSFSSAGNQLEMITVTACNANGCSDPSAPIFDEVAKPCP